ncbi:nicotinic acid mononucleotide adenyltransferase [Sediminicola sp. YIK13]|uniref:toxin-antitoxin system YwqK family antitoxin n=1 Tax=Sediminicola sp. YIK13 TaxID=1453352 RepID=UPI00071FB8EE|nr:nicotinic acid mononucleotide adenyltransferase [Sediminicola sp. YIK13]ALM08291.1 nicotinic acid mononucleotide adenyltransferase [Sediminicola sp. YIK13]
MKINLILIAFLLAFASHAQAPDPTFVKDGDLIKGTYFHENGNIAQTGHFLEGKLHGEWIMYNEEGDKTALGSYVNGKKVGKWFFWKSEGLNEVDFKDSRIASVTQWNSAGTLVVNK